MGYVSIDVDIDDILWNLSPREKQKLANDLYADGFLPVQIEDKVIDENEIRFAHSFDFDAQVKKLIGNSWRLTKEDEETILRIANKLI